MKQKSATHGFFRKEICIFSILAILLIDFVILFINHKLDFKQIAKTDLKNDKSEWVYYVRIYENNLDDIDKLSPELSRYDYDFTNHTYIVTFGYELVKISYSKGSKTLFHESNYYVPDVYLSENKSDMCYVYELPKVNIDSDSDNYKRKVHFVR